MRWLKQTSRRQAGRGARLIRAVIDTNILIRAIIKPEGTVGPILGRLRDGDYEIILSEPLLTEFVDVINRPRIKDKYDVDSEDIETVLSLLLLRGRTVAPVERIELCRDPQDNMILEAALAAKADFIVSGDEDLLVLNPFRDIPVVGPVAFLQIFDQ